MYQLLGGKVRDRVRVYCDSGAREMIPGDERSKARIKQIQDMGFTAAKIDIDDATDPARFDRVNWTASNGEIDHMVAKVAFTRELYPKNFDLAVDMHGRYDATTGKRVAKELEPFKLMWLEEPVPAGEYRRHARRARLHQHADLLRRERLHALGLPRDSRKARGRHHHARFPEVRRAAGVAQDRRYGAYLLRAGRAARRDLAHRHDGHRARLRRHPEFPGRRNGTGSIRSTCGATG